MAANEVLFVDDDQHFLSSINRSLIRKLPILCVSSVSEALELLENRTFPVVVSDMKMPGMNGVDFLRVVKKKYPDSVRILFTGFADQATAVEAVNQGEIFRFLTKPCDISILLQILNDGLHQHQLIISEKELLEKTLLRTIRTLSELLSLVNPVAQQRSNRLRGYCHYLASEMGCRDLWFFEVVALLSQIGCANIAPDELDKYYTRILAVTDNKTIIDDHPAIASELLSHIPRLEEAAQAIAMQNDHFSSYRKGEIRCSPKTELAAQILHIAIAIDSLSRYSHQSFDNIQAYLSDSSRFNPAIVGKFSHAIDIDDNFEIADVLLVKDLKVGMILTEELRANSGVLLASSGQELTDFILIGIKKYAQKIGVNEPVAVRIPTTVNK